MVKARELTRDNVGINAELSAVVDVNGYSHPCSVKAYFAVECVPSEVWCFCTLLNQCTIAVSHLEWR